MDQTPDTVVSGVFAFPPLLQQDGRMATVTQGMTATTDFVVTDADTAQALLSGDLPVLGTPRLLAWMEAATCGAVAAALPPGQTTVGTRVSLEHRAASSVGARLTVAATVTHVDGRLLRFEAVATDAQSGVVLGHAEITRVVVDRERFLARVG